MSKLDASQELRALAERSMVAMRAANYAEAAALLERAIELAPTLGILHSNLGEARRRLGRKAEALQAFRRAVEHSPELAETHYNLGLTLEQLGQSPEASAAYRAALERKPAFAPAALGLLATLRASARYDEAIAWYEQHAGGLPDTAELRCAIAGALADVFRLDEALAHLDRARELAPNSGRVHADRAATLVELGEVDPALGELRQAIELEPENAMYHSNLIYLLPFSARVLAEDILREARMFGERHAPAAKPPVGHGNDRDPERKLRIGYVSPDFRVHPAALFLLPLFRQHDRNRVHVIGYSNVKRPDAVTNELQSSCDEWRDISGLDDEQAAQLIREDRVDILVDLAQHSAGHRLLLFARKPAPVQLSWLGYPGTTGVPAIDYRLSDPYLDPLELADGRGTETVLRLPETFWCYAPLSAEPPVNELPALRNGHVTFGSLNSFKKVSDQALSLWGRVLRATPGSRLLLIAPNGKARDRVWRFLAAESVAPERVELIAPLPRPEYLQAYQRVDIALDPHPYSGGTTSLDAFWMGVPVVTLLGETAVSRSTTSLAQNLNLPQLIATSPQDYVTRTATLANDLRSLAELRRGLRQRLEHSPLMDAPRFARSVEQAYADLWSVFLRKAAS